MVTTAEVLRDLTDESAELDGLVAGLPTGEWARPTPAPGWSIAHQIAHLAWTDAAAVLAMTDRDAFIQQLSGAITDPDGFVDRGAESFLADPDVLLARWRSGRDAVVDALAAVPEGEKVLWYGTAMTARSLATARLMETWAHGLDVVDSLAVARRPTARLRHIAHLGHRTFGHSFRTHGRPVPDVTVRVAVTGPDGSLWTFGPEDAAETVTGPALDFCLLVAQRRPRADLALVATGPATDEWLNLAQAFAGPPGRSTR